MRVKLIDQLLSGSTFTEPFFYFHPPARFPGTCTRHGDGVRADGNTLRRTAWGEEPWKNMSKGTFPPGHRQAWPYLHIPGCSVQPERCRTQTRHLAPISRALFQVDALAEVSLPQKIRFDLRSPRKVGKGKKCCCYR